MAIGVQAGFGRAGLLVLTAAILAALTGCASSVSTSRPAYSPEPTGGVSDALVFHAEPVRAAHAERPALSSLAAADSARSDHGIGIRTAEQNLNRRLYESSEWHSAPTHHPPILFFNQFGGFFGGDIHSGSGRRRGFSGHGGFSGFTYDPTIPILSPARERSFGYPY